MREFQQSIKRLPFNIFWLCLTVNLLGETKKKKIKNGHQKQAFLVYTMFSYFVFLPLILLSLQFCQNRADNCYYGIIAITFNFDQIISLMKSFPEAGLQQ